MSESIQNTVVADQGEGSNLSMIAGVFVIVIIAMMVMFSYTDLRYQRNNQLYKDIHQQQMIAGQLGMDIEDIAKNRLKPGIDALRTHTSRFEQLLRDIRTGVTGKGISSRTGLTPALQTVDVVWQDYRADISIILNGEHSLSKLTGLLVNISLSIPEIVSLSEEVARDLVKNGANARDIYNATRQLVLIQRIEKGVNDISRSGMIGDETRSRIYSSIGRDSAIFEQTLQAMLGSGQLKVSDDAIRDKLSGILLIYHRVSDSITGILNLEPELARLNFAVRDSIRIKPSFIQATGTLVQAFDKAEPQYNITPLMWTLLGAGVLVFITLIILQLISIASNGTSRPDNISPQELVDFVQDSIGDIAGGDYEARPRRELTSSYHDAVNTALEPVRKHAEHVDQTVVQILSVSNGMHESILAIVEVSDGLAQQADSAENTLEDTVNTMKRGMDEAINLKGMLDKYVQSGMNSARAPVSELESGITRLDDQVDTLQQSMLLIREYLPDISGVAGRISSEASKINLIALNTAIHVNGDDEPVGLFAADEIQQHAHRITGISRRLTELDDEFATVIGKILADVATFKEHLGVLTMPGEEGANSKGQSIEDNATLIDRIGNVVTILERQFNSLNEAADGIASLQQHIVDLSAGVNDIMAGVESLEKLAAQLRDSWKNAGADLPKC